MLAATLSWGSSQPSGSTEVLVTVGPYPVTAKDLEQAIQSSPLATQFNTLDEDQQASIRGGVLQRLVASRLLRLEAQARGLDRSEPLRRDLENFRLGLLHRRYMEQLRAGIQIPPDTMARMKEQFKGNYDAYKAAQSAYIAGIYKDLRLEEIRRLRERYGVQVYEDRMQPSAAPETILLDGDGIRIRYADLLDQTDKVPTNKDWINDRLYLRAELLLTARAATDAGIDVSDQLAGYREERLPALLLEKLEREWLPDDAPLRAYFEQHPELGRIEERRHIGQIVLAEREQAEDIRRRILSGESLFALAGEHSIDPYGRAHKGDMGWIKADVGYPTINRAIAELPDNAISEVIETPAGFHIVTILERKPGEQRPYERVRDKVRQQYLSEHLEGWLEEQKKKYQIVWHLPERPATAE